MIVHDHDLRRWAREAQDSIQAPNFEASRPWVSKFKARHNIVSRKITKFTTQTAMQNEDVLRQTADTFVTNVRQLIPRYELDNIFNADQSGFALELHSSRTLMDKGAKTIAARVQSLSSTTHSYTIQPFVSASGRLMSPLLVVLKEQSGQLGPRVAATVFRPPNVYIMASKSGKLTAQHFQTWFTDVYLPNTGADSLLLIDAWGGQRPENLHDLIPHDKKVQVMTIPAGTTGSIQPLDVYGFRPWKQFVRQFSDMVRLSQLDCNLHQRDNILKLQSLAHNQFSSPRYVDLFRYGWYKGGYLTERPEPFATPIQFCFREEATFLCDICGAHAFLRCSWCKQHLCFKHFFTDYHYCTNYVP